MEDRAGAWDIFCPEEGVVPATPNFSVWAVFDGHGSSAISSYLQVAFHLRLQRRLCAAVNEGHGDRLPGHTGPPQPAGGAHQPRCWDVPAALRLAFEDLDSELGNASRAGDWAAPPPASAAQPMAAAAAGCASVGAAAGVVAGPVARALAAAAATSWESGSTAVVAVADWGSPPGRQTGQETHDASGGAACNAADAGSGTGGPAPDGVAANGNSSAPGPAGLWGELWVASVGNSRAVLCSTVSAPAAMDSPIAPGGAAATKAAVLAPSGEAGTHTAPDSATSPVSTVDGAGNDAAAESSAVGSVRARRRAAAARTEGLARVAAGASGRQRQQRVAQLLNDVHEFDDKRERRRVEAAGGRVEQPARPGGKRRLMGDLEVSRAFGDLQYRPVGLIAVPDVSGPWLLRAHSGAGSSPAGPAAELVLVSDGVMEVMRPQEVCDHVLAQLSGATEPPLTPPPPPPIALGPVPSEQAQEPGYMREEQQQQQQQPGVDGTGEAPSSEPREGLPGCCDCDLRSTAGRERGGEDPCGSQALSLRMNRRPECHTVEYAAERLVQEALNRGSMDNVAAIVVQLPAYEILWPEGAQRSLPSTPSAPQRPCPADTVTSSCMGAVFTDGTCRPEAATASQHQPEEATGPHVGASAGRGLDGVGARLASNAPRTAEGLESRALRATKLKSPQPLDTHDSGCKGLRGAEGLGADPSSLTAVVAPATGAAMTASTEHPPVDAAAGACSGGIVEGQLVPWRWDPSAEAPRWPAAGAATLRRCWVRTRASAGAAGTAGTAGRAPVPAHPPPGPLAVQQDRIPGRFRAAGVGDGAVMALFGGGLVPAGGGLAVRLLRILRAGFQAVCRRIWRPRDGAATSSAGPGEGGGGEGGARSPRRLPLSSSAAYDDSVLGGASGSGVAGALMLVCPRPGDDDGGAAGSGSGSCGEDEWSAGGEGSDGGAEGAEDAGLQGGGYGYLLQERIAAVPSAAYHLHSPIPGLDALPPWQLSDFAGGGGSAGWLIDSLQPHVLYEHGEGLPSTPLVPVVDSSATAVDIIGAEGPPARPLWRTNGVAGGGDVSLRGGLAGDGGGDSGDGARALMSYGTSTHSLLVEIGSVPLQLALAGPREGSRGPAADAGRNAGGSEARGGARSGSNGGGGLTGSGMEAHVASDGAPDAGGGLLLMQSHDWQQLLPAQHRRLHDDDPDPAGDLPDERLRGHHHHHHHPPESDDNLHGWSEGLVPPQLSLGPAADGSGLGGGGGGALALSVGASGRMGRALLWDADAGSSSDDDGGGVDGTRIEDLGEAEEGAGNTEAWKPAQRGPRGGGADAEQGPFVTLVGVGGVRGGDSGGGSADNTGGTAMVVGGAQLQFQPRAHGVRQADGAVHLVTSRADAAGCDDAAAAAPTPAAAAATSAPSTAAASTSATAVAREYRLRERFGQGHFGEVWRAWRLERGPPPAPAATDQRPGASGQRDAGRAAGATAGGAAGYVLKRLRSDGGPAVLLSGLREAYFGDLLRRLRHVAPAAGTAGGATANQSGGDLGGRGGGELPPPDDAGQRRRPSGAPSCHDYLVEFIESFEVVPELESPTASPAYSEAGGSDSDHRPVGGDSTATTGSGSGGSGSGGSGSGGEPDSGAGAGATPDLWLVFGDAGQSLHDLIYSPVGLHPTGWEEGEESRQPGGTDADGSGAGGGGRSFQVLGPSPWWHAMRRHPGGHDFVRELLRQLLTGLQVVHEANITHRDIKPENMMLVAMPRHRDSGGTSSSSGSSSSSSGSRGGQPTAAGPGGEGAGGSREGERATDSAVAPVWLRLIDFGSAVDSYSLQHLYGSEGPTSDQLTLEYAPPEALFGRYWEGMRAMRPRAWAYDMWSVGVVWLELLMATPQVWQLPAATRALLEVRLALRGRPESERHLVFLLRGLMEWCIYPPQAPATPAHGPPLRGRKSRLLMSWSCTEEALLALAQSRDPLGLGLEGPMALRLLMRLLHWDPASRPSARQALQHAFFTVSPSAWATHPCSAAPEGEPGWC